MIDKLPSRPKFRYEEVTLTGRTYPFFHRNILECIKALFGDIKFASAMIYVPEQHFKDVGGQQRLYHDMNTGKWWWKMQVGSEFKQ
jgi:hypothetical protein